jgi:hypothetical protein
LLLLRYGLLVYGLLLLLLLLQSGLLIYGLQLLLLLLLLAALLMATLRLLRLAPVMVVSDAVQVLEPAHSSCAVADFFGVDNMLRGEGWQ